MGSAAQHSQECDPEDTFADSILEAEMTLSEEMEYHENNKDDWFNCHCPQWWIQD